MHWIWLWATFKENNLTTINAPTNTLVVQKYANYNAIGNRTTTSSYLNSGLRIWTKKMKRVIDKLLAEYFPKKSEHRFAVFYFGTIPFYFKLFMCSRWGHSYTSSAFAITCILTFISYDATRFDLANIFVVLPNKNTFCDPDLFVEGSGKYPRGPEAAGVESIMSNDTFLSYTLH